MRIETSRQSAAQQREQFDFDYSSAALDPTEPADSDAVRAQARAILDEPQFRHFQRLKGGLNSSNAFKTKAPPPPKTPGSAPPFTLPNWLSGIGPAAAALIQGMAWLAVAAVCLLVVYLVVRAVGGMELARNKDRSGGDAPLEGEDDPTHAPGAQPADAWLARARELAAAGRFHEAVAHLLLGALSHIERSELIRYRRGLTHDDYLRAVRSQKDMHRGLTLIVRTYDPLGFGRRQATRQHFDQSLSGYEAGFRATS